MKIQGSTCRKVTFSDVTNSYIYVLFGFFAHLYIISSGSIYFSLEQEITHHLGVTRATLVNYFAFLSIILLLISLSLKWTWPIRIEELLIVFFIWILLRNLIPKECLCCGHDNNQQIIDTLANEAGPTIAPQPQPNTTTTTTTQREEEEDGHCPWKDFNHLYSVMCVLVMITSFLMHARSYLVSITFTAISIVLMILTSLIPVSCNQLSVANANINLVKFTLYSIVWFLNRRMRLSEQSLFQQYLKSMRIYYTSQDCSQKHLLCGYRHVNKSRRQTGTNRYKQWQDECDEIACFIHNDDECIIPRPLFEHLDRLSKIVLQQKTAKNNRKRCNDSGPQGDRMRNHAWQSHQMLKIYEINNTYNARRWFGNFFSWKNQYYDNDALNLFDLAKTLWILNVCPIYLLFVALEYFIINYHISWNIQELQCLIERVKVMSFIRCAAGGTDPFR